MLSTSAVKGLSLALILASIFKTGPYNWDSETQSLVVCRRQATRLRFILITTLLTLHFLYVSTRALVYILFQSGSATSFLLQLMIVGQEAIAIACHFNTVYRAKEMAEFITKFLQVDRHLTCMYPIVFCDLPQ